ncbi:MAG: hypothetical protein HC839_01980 [Leptolyngbyaceae cyanobacterium RM2_2_21]|nr:hypothetical protein [Leptolyngbyaceae cyanobacterium RM2_2_21]
MVRCLTFKQLSLAGLVSAGLLSSCRLQPAAAQAQIRPLPPIEQDGTAPLSSVTSPDYVLGSGDRLSINVIGYPEFDIERIVLPDGSISVPLVGSIPAAGSTVSKLTADLDSRLRRFLVNPVVSMSLTETRPVVVTVAGEVYRPGPVQLLESRDSQEIPTPQSGTNCRRWYSAGCRHSSGDG